MKIQRALFVTATEYKLIKKALAVAAKHVASGLDKLAMEKMLRDLEEERSDK